jgi:hypothetical protein
MVMNLRRLLGGFLLAVPLIGFGAQITWQGNSSTDMTSAANWLGGVSPATGVDGIILEWII